MPTILIVDDDDAVRGTLFELLSENYECHTAGLAEQALQYLEIESYDAVLTDLAMPGLNGDELLKIINAEHPGTPVILISGKGSDQESDLLRDHGAFAYIPKPFSLEQIEQVVERAIAAK